LRRDLGGLACFNPGGVGTKYLKLMPFTLVCPAETMKP
jgi:hypothetical protein